MDVHVVTVNVITTMNMYVDVVNVVIINVITVRDLNANAIVIAIASHALTVIRSCVNVSVYVIVYIHFAHIIGIDGIDGIDGIEKIKAEETLGLKTVFYSVGMVQVVGYNYRSFDKKRDMSTCFFTYDVYSPAIRMFGLKVDPNGVEVRCPTACAKLGIG
jgi:hypothetical protein